VAAPKPNIQEAAGLTDREMETLSAIAADYHASLASLSGQPGHSVFEALMESIESGKDDYPDPQQQLKDRETQRQRIVSDHVQQLRIAFGEARFQALTAWLRGDEASRPKKARQ
jgi:hypothetical protein